MVIAQDICSDKDCAAEADVVVAHPLELEATLCAACDCACVVLSLSEWTRAEARLPVLALAA